MLRVWALSGEPIAECHLDDFKLQESDRSPVVVLKRLLGAQLGCSRFCFKLMGEDSTEIADDTPLADSADFWLVRMDFQLPDPDIDTAFLSACAEGPATEVQRLLEAPQNPLVRETGFPNDGIMGIHVAACHGHLEIMELLLEAGSDKDEVMIHDFTVLHMAALHGRVDVVGFLLEARADKDAATRRGWKALHLAAYKALHVAGDHKHSDVVRLLLEAGTDIHVAKQDGSTALHVSAERGHSDIVQLLLEARADTDAATQAGATPLYAATRNGHWNVVQLLLEAGADIQVATQDGRTLLQMAAWNCQWSVLRMLLWKLAGGLCKRRKAD